MSRLFMPLAVLGLVMTAVVTAGDSSESCLKSGANLPVFYVTKVAGAEDDGVEPDQELCYRCKYGQSPMVMVFARDTGGKVNELVKKLDSAVAANKESQLKGLVTLMGKDASALKATAAKVAKTSGAKMVPVVVAQQNEKGPASYKIDEDAAVTVVLASDSQVVASHTFATADKVDIAAVMGGVKKMLN